MVLASRSLDSGNLEPSNSSLPQRRAPPIPHRHSRCARPASPTQRRRVCSQRSEPGSFQHRVSGHEAQQHNLGAQNHARQIEDQPTRHTSFDTLVDLSTTSVDHDTTEPSRIEQPTHAQLTCFSAFEIPETGAKHSHGQSMFRPTVTQ